MPSVVFKLAFPFRKQELKIQNKKLNFLFL
jgi:hypothetical protein